MKTIQDGFTGDVIALIGVGNPDERRAILRQVDDEPLGQFIRNGIVMSLTPFMQKAPAFVAQIVGRALMEHVDWDEVAEWAMTDPEAN